MLVFGMEVAMVIRRGVWSEVGRTKDVSEEFGKEVHCSELTNTRSRRARVGFWRFVTPSVQPIEQRELHNS